MTATAGMGESAGRCAGVGVSMRRMQVKLLFFAAIEELLGKREAELSLEQDAVTAEDFIELLEQHFPELSGRMVSVRLAINESFAAPGDRVRHGDVVALIPPVSGG